MRDVEFDGGGVFKSRVPQQLFPASKVAVHDDLLCKIANDGDRFPNVERIQQGPNFDDAEVLRLVDHDMVAQAQRFS